MEHKVVYWLYASQSRGVHFDRFSFRKRPGIKGLKVEIEVRFRINLHAGDVGREQWSIPAVVCSPRARPSRANRRIRKTRVRSRAFPLITISKHNLRAEVDA